MQTQSNVPLNTLTTMRLGGPAHYVVVAQTPEEVQKTVQKARHEQLPVFAMGSGSNIIARDEGFAGILLLNRIPGFEVVAQDEAGVQVKIGAGSSWDDVVKRTVEMELSGIEALSAIPGTAGATPVQNVGAYGQEIADTLVELEAYDMEQDQFVVLKNEDCGFAYRNSIFKSTAARRYIIISITLKLRYTPLSPPLYKSLQEYLDARNITTYTPQVVRDAVVAIRRDKLPDPSQIANTGSFFKNPIVEKWLVDELRKTYDDMPAYAMADGRYKVPAGWLIDRAELRGYQARGMQIYEKNALVVVNRSASSYADLAAFREDIITRVRDQFRITLEQEPEEL